MQEKSQQSGLKRRCRQSEFVWNVLKVGYRWLFVCKLGSCLSHEENWYIEKGWAEISFAALEPSMSTRWGKTKNIHVVSLSHLEDKQFVWNWLGQCSSKNRLLIPCKEMPPEWTRSRGWNSCRHWIWHMFRSREVQKADKSWCRALQVAPVSRNHDPWPPPRTGATCRLSWGKEVAIPLVTYGKFSRFSLYYPGPSTLSPSLEEEAEAQATI